MTLQEPAASTPPETSVSPSASAEPTPEPAASTPPETSVSPSASAEPTPDPFPSGFHYCQSGHRCGCDFGAAEPGDTSTAHGGHPCGWNGWELNADLDHVSQAPPPVEASEPAADEAPI